MNTLNTKIKAGRQDHYNDAQVVGVHGLNTADDGMKVVKCTDDNALVVDVHGGATGSGDLKCRTDIADPATSTFVKCNADGTLEMTAELSTAGLATEAKQDDLINATNRAINNTGAIGDGSTNATSVALGYDRAGGQGRAVLVNTAGELMVNLGSSTTQNVNCFGKDGGGTARELLLESNGAFVLGGGSSSALGNTSADGSGDAKFLLTDASGHLQVDIVSGGGGGGSTQYAVGTTGMATGTGTLMIGNFGGTAKEVAVNNNGQVVHELGFIDSAVLGQDTAANSLPVVIASDNTVAVKATEATNLGSSTNLANNITLTSSGGTSSTVSIDNMNIGNILYEDTNTGNFDGIEVELSADVSGVDFFRQGTLFPTDNTAVTKRTAFQNIQLQGITHIRLINNSSTTFTNVKATIVGSP
jgi:hypothetical protein